MASHADKVIYVIGTPNGGTSVVAGMLYHLGVNMGNCPLEPKVRSYVTFEDIDINQFKDTPEPAQMDTRVPWFPLRIREYLEWRLADYRDTSRVPGVKHSCLFLLSDKQPQTLPITPVFVHRNLARSVKAGQKFWRDERGEALLQQEYPHLFLTHQAGPIARSWVGMQILEGMFLDSVHINFEDVLASPIRAANHLKSKLDLDSSPDEVMAAIDFVDPSIRHF